MPPDHGSLITKVFVLLRGVIVLMVNWVHPLEFLLSDRGQQLLIVQMECVSVCFIVARTIDQSA